MSNTFLNLNRRSILMVFLSGFLGGIFRPKSVLASIEENVSWSLSNEEWKARLSAKAFNVLRQEGTERPFTSSLNEEKREGKYHCAGCDLPLFSSAAKFNSGTGWPSFWEALPDSIEQKVDFKLIVPRDEYHCSRCGGHQGHVFNDGPRPTGKRFCNNGVALTFRPLN